MTITDLRPDPILFLDDYCPRCNPLGEQAERRVRECSLTAPCAITWHGGKRVICEYECDGCGHQWARHDLWDAQSAGFDPKHRKAA
jgi:hypothetical protein